MSKYQQKSTHLFDIFTPSPPLFTALGGKFGRFFFWRISLSFIKIYIFKFAVW